MRTIFQVVILSIACLCSATVFADITVAADGTGDVRSVQQAIDRVADNNASRVVIRIKPGVYKEQIRIPASKPLISFIGIDAAKTILTFDLSAKAANSTSASYSTYIGGHDFGAENITFENSFGQGSQAVAVLVDADRAVFKNCRFLGWQDTLYAKSGRQYYKDCYIEGHVDFIFGQAAAVFDSCEIHSKADGFIAAPMRFADDEPSGLIFYRSKLTSSGTKQGVYLGRPWRDYGRAVYIDTTIDAQIRPEGWNHWEPQREKTAFLAEYHSTGPGANDTARVPWARHLQDADTRAFAPQNFLRGQDGWDPTLADDKWVTIHSPVQSAVSWNDVLKQKSAWYQTDEAARIADQVLVYQKTNGGWEKNIDMAAMLTATELSALAAKKGDVSETTIDNRTSYTQVAFLAKMITASKLKPSPPVNLPKYIDGFFKGFDYLLAAQYENGGWPQYWPLRTGYYTHITFNDDAMIGVMRVLRDAARGESDYAFVDQARRDKAARAVAKGVALILKLQIEIAGKKTVWGQQYDEYTLKLAWARKYEPPCLTAGESVGIVRFLMDEPQTPDIRAAIESAIAWYKTNELNGIRWERKDGQNSVVKDPTAPSLWSRYYEVETMKPIFLGRDSVIHYDVMQIEAERRNGYAWYVSTPNALLDKDYPAWKAKNK
jgi:PelA/Pel-15E family pectate lyase